MYEAPPPPPSSPPQTTPKSRRHHKAGSHSGSSLSQHKKKETPKVKSRLPSPTLVGSTFATNLKGGSFDRPVTPTTRRVSTGSTSSPGDTPPPSSQRIRTQRGSVSNSARAANIKYPIFQPDFSPPEPPPPPPPKHKYKVTLGMRGGSNRPNQSTASAPLLRQDSHHLKNDILRVQQVSDSQHMTPSSPRDKRNVIENTSKNRPMIVQSNSGTLTVSSSLPSSPLLASL
jgi:hypothetical protein